MNLCPELSLENVTNMDIVYKCKYCLSAWLNYGFFHVIMTKCLHKANRMCIHQWLRCRLSGVNDPNFCGLCGRLSLEQYLSVNISGSIENENRKTFKRIEGEILKLLEADDYIRRHCENIDRLNELLEQELLRHMEKNKSN